MRVFVCVCLCVCVRTHRTKMLRGLNKTCFACAYVQGHRVNAHVTGHVTSHDVTGNATGHVTGNVTGHVTPEGGDRDIRHVFEFDASLRFGD